MPWTGIIILGVLIIFVVIAVFFQDKINTEKIRKVLERIFEPNIEVEFTLGVFYFLAFLLAFINIGDIFFLLLILVWGISGAVNYFIFYKKNSGNNESIPNK